MCCVPSVFQWQPADSFQLIKQPADSTGRLDPFPFPAFPSTELVRSIFPHVLLCLQACRASSVGAEQTWVDMH